MCGYSKILKGMIIMKVQLQLSVYFRPHKIFLADISYDFKVCEHLVQHCSECSFATEGHGLSISMVFKPIYCLFMSGNH